MRILLTGATGFIGSHMAHAFRAAGHDLRLLVRPTSSLEALTGLEYERVVADLREEAGLAQACVGMDAVVHVAAVIASSRESQFDQTNAQGTARLARAAAEAGVDRFLYLSSLAALGPSPRGAPEPPDTTPHPVSAYGESKLRGEEAALALGDRLSVQVLRPPVVYGPRDRGLLPFFRLARRRVVPRLGDGRNQISLIHVTDLADATAALLAAEPAPSPRFHINDAEGPYTWRALIDTLGEAFGHAPLQIPVPALGFEAMARVSVGLARMTRRPPLLDRSRVTEMRQRAWLADNAALTAATRWTPRIALRDGLHETAHWYRRHGWL